MPGDFSQETWVYRSKKPGFWWQFKKVIFYNWGLCSTRGGKTSGFTVSGILSDLQSIIYIKTQSIGNNNNSCNLDLKLSLVRRNQSDGHLFVRFAAEFRGHALPIFCLLALKKVKTPGVLSLKYPFDISFPARLVGHRFVMMLNRNIDCLLKKNSINIVHS